MSLEHIPDDGLRERFELLKGAEHHKNELITVSQHCDDHCYWQCGLLSQATDSEQELLRRLDKLDIDYQQVALDHQRETQFNREGQLREREMKEELRRLKNMMV